MNSATPVAKSNKGTLHNVGNIANDKAPRTNIAKVKGLLLFILFLFYKLYNMQNTKPLATSVDNQWSMM